MSNINETTGHSSDSNTIVVVPCYNESENIPRITLKISKMKEKGSLKGIDFVFVNDGSSDDSLVLIKCFSEEHEWFKCANHEVNKGFAPALKTGREYALKNGYDIIGQIDCDMTHPLDMIDGMRDMLDRCDMVLASRYVGDGGMKNVPFQRVLLSRTAQIFFRTVFRIKTKDATSGFRFCRKEIFEEINLEIETFAVQLELTIKAERKKYKICEVPFVLVNREFGSSKFNLNQLLIYVDSVLKLIF